MTTPIDSEDFKGVHVSTLFEGCAAELERMRTIGMRVENSICTLAGPLGLSGEYIEDLQQMDFLLQQLAAIRDILAGMARQPGADALLDVAAVIDTIGLKDLKTRLLGELVVADASGGVDFFDDSEAA
ncbi:hypothetical protein [Terricaulis sp.]|uniref:hypothetical protein n=1 Tax=Terricaulis sp. TaxID=2768686 RepID=UPI003784058F